MWVEEFTLNPLFEYKQKHPYKLFNPLVVREPIPTVIKNNMCFWIKKIVNIYDVCLEAEWDRCEHEHGQTQREVNSINMALFTLFHITTYNQLPIKLVNTQHFTKGKNIISVRV